MLCPASQEQRAASGLRGAHDVGGYHFIALDIVDEGSVDILDGGLREFRRHPEFRVAGVTLCSKGVVSVIVRALMLKRNRATLHVDDRMVPIFARWRGDEADNVPGFYCLITCSNVKADKW